MPFLRNSNFLPVPFNSKLADYLSLAPLPTIGKTKLLLGPGWHLYVYRVVQHVLAAGPMTELREMSSVSGSMTGFGLQI